MSITILSNLQSNPLNEINKQKLLELLKDPEYRLEFLVYLNNARTTGIFLVSRDSFIQLGRILHYIVELILSKKDYESMRYLLVLTQTYYFINKYGQKIYLLRYIENHELFQSNEFWEFFFSDSIFQEIEKQNKSEQPEQETQEENKKRFSNVVFSKLLSLAHNMMEFKLEKEKITSLINVFAKQYDVDAKLETQIITLVKEVEYETKNLFNEEEDLAEETKEQEDKGNENITSNSGENNAETENKEGETDNTEQIEN